MHRSPHRVRTVVMGIALAVFAVACGSDEPASEFASTDGPLVSITLARTPIPAEGESSTPVYGIVANNTDAVVRIVGATSPVADDVVLQRPSGDGPVTVDDGLPIDVEAGVVMEPGGFQLTLLGVDRAAFDAPVPVVLVLATGDEFAFEATPVDISE